MSRGKKRPKPAETGGGSRLARRLIAVLLTLAVVAGLVWGVAYLGDAARRGIGPRDRYACRFADIACDAPPGFDPPTFLAEVRYASNFSESFQSLDPELNATLGAAFTKHPWVAGFDGATVDRDGRVSVKLRFRVPVLAVDVTDGTTRVVDAAGVLLPLNASAENLPRLVTPQPAPVAPAGQAWANERVKRAAELADAHHPRKLEETATGWRLTMPDGTTLTAGK